MIYFGMPQLVFIEEFVNFCKKNNIWYSVDEKTLLHLLSNQNNLSNENCFMIMMTWQSYSRLKRLKPLNVIDASKKYWHQKTMHCFYVDKNFFQNISKNSFSFIIKIRIILPTTIKRVKKFNNFFCYIYQKIWGYPTTLNNAVNFLYQKQNNGFLWLDWRFKKITTNWSPTIDFTTIEIPLAHFKVAIAKNSLQLLQTWFGDEINQNETFIEKHFFNGDNNAS